MCKESDTDKNKTGSDSRIIIKCKEAAVPQFNRIQLRTYPPTFIELSPGENILTVKEFPALKYGFRQIKEFDLEEDDDNDYTFNCQGVLSVDLRYFDPSEVTSMDNMFEGMNNLTRIDFGSKKFKNISSLCHAFRRLAYWCLTGTDGEILNLSSIDFSKVKDTKEMLDGCNFNTVNLSRCDMSNVIHADDMFTPCGIRELILDGAKLSSAVIDAIIAEDWSDSVTFSLKGVDIEVIELIISNIVRHRPDHWPPIKFILDDTLDYKIIKNNEENKVEIFYKSVLNNSRINHVTKDYIRIVCSSYAEADSNKIQMRTDKYNIIQLHSGENILSLEDYPGLVYGFRSCEDSCSLSGCAENPWILEVDLSKLNNSFAIYKLIWESIDHMFCNMTNLRYVNMNIHIEDPGYLGVLVKKLNPIRSMAFMFYNTPKLQKVEGLENLNAFNVDNMDYMFYNTGLCKINLSYWYSKSVYSCVGIFSNAKAQEIRLANDWMSKRMPRVTSNDALKDSSSRYILPEKDFASPLAWLAENMQYLPYDDFAKTIICHNEVWQWIVTKGKFTSIKEISLWSRSLSDKNILPYYPSKTRNFLNPFGLSTEKYWMFQGSILECLLGGSDVCEIFHTKTPIIPFGNILYQFDQIGKSLFAPSYDSDAKLPDFIKAVEEVEVFLVTSELEGRVHMVHNLFCKEDTLQTVPICQIPSESGIFDALGMYIPNTGSIYIWIDKIFEYRNFQLLFQSVLLHELIHLLFDVMRKNLKLKEPQNKMEEESIDNCLMLYCYSQAIDPFAEESSPEKRNYSYQQIRKFVDTQADFYRKGGVLFDGIRSWGDMRSKLLSFLTN